MCKDIRMFFLDRNFRSGRLLKPEKLFKMYLKNLKKQKALNLSLKSIGFSPSSAALWIYFCHQENSSSC